MKLLDVQGLKVHFPVKTGLFGKTGRVVRAVEDVGFHIEPGETLGLVGESGCGKSTVGRAVVRLVKPSAGTIRFEGRDISNVSGDPLKRLRRDIQMIFQDPYSSLDPRMTVGDIIGEAMDIHHLAASPKMRREKTGELLQQVGLNAAHIERFPHEFSGGQRQRIGIARALAVEPKLVICDEPVSALDVSVQAQIVNLLKDLQQSRGISYLFIAHDLAVVEHLSHRVMVMYLGRVVEQGNAKEVCRNPQHPYTQALIEAVPTVGESERKRAVVNLGEIPSPINPPSGCAFHPRCPLAIARCKSENPALREIGRGRFVACHLAPDLE